MSKKKSSFSETGPMFRIPFEGELDQELEFMAYAFDCRGRLLTDAPFNLTAEAYNKPNCHSCACYSDVDSIKWVKRGLPDLEIWRLQDDSCLF